MPGNKVIYGDPPKELIDLRNGLITFEELFPGISVNGTSAKNVNATSKPNVLDQKQHNNSIFESENRTSIEEGPSFLVTTNESGLTWILTVVGSIFILLFFVSIIIYVRKKRKTQIYNHESNVEYAMKNHFEMKDLNIDVFMDTVGAQLPPHHIIDYKDIKIVKIIGEGYFGLVYSAQLRRNKQKESIKVAVKKLKEVQTSYKSFLEEGQIMLKFKHPNILELEGFSFLPDRTPLIVTAFMENGSLLDYLLSKACDSTNFIRFCKEICSGMMYMHSLHYVHRDLAARNCMLDSSLTIKICDFGLTRSFDSYINGYRQVAPGPIPIQWIPVEIFTAAIEAQPLEFTHACDIWAFGVLMYEVFTKGYKPYAKMSPNQIAEYLFAGNRLDQPVLCDNKFYDLMLRCWATEPDDRPGFHVLYHVFKINMTKPEVKPSIDHSVDNVGCEASYIALSFTEEASADSGTQLVA